MKTFPLARFTALSRAPGTRPSCCGSSKSGVALVIVLVMLALVAILLIAFLSNAATELRSAKSYAVGLDVRALADSAVNIVISQIQDATTAPTNAWASQPGMIRTYATTGAAVTAYKLYSADQLRITGTFTANSGPSTDPTSQSTDVPSNWATLPDQYTDLNKPVVVSGVSHYPIIDPGAVANGQASTTAMDGTTTPIQGCYLDTANAATGTTTTQTDPVPMPVKWLYVLQDGTITTITSAGTITGATSGNPIVGRMAFWTDDETCKVNVNTSGEGTFWDRPMAESAYNAGDTAAIGYERNFLASTIPTQNEFQRYQGHPAMTSLSVIFPPIGGESTHDYNERIYGIIPRLATGGSQSGTVATSTTTPIPVPNAARLFGSVDEFLFSTGTTTPRTANLKAPATSFTDSDIEKTRFFLTASSRAPEVNMFNKPRITLWPIQFNTAYRSAKDQLIAFCSTIGSTAYFFQRYNTDTTPARTGTTTPYLSSLTQNPIPSSQSPSLDWTNVPRNQTLFQYLQYLTSNPIPGVGGSLSGSSTAKYSTPVRDQILTEMMDFIRSEIASASTGGTPQYFYAPGLATSGYETGERQVVPLVITPPASSGYQTKGFGRFPTIKQAALVFYRQDQATYTGSASANYTYLQNTTPPTNPYNTTTTSGHPVHLGAVLVLDVFNPTPGSRPWCPNVRFVETGLGGIKVGNTNLPIADGTSLLLDEEDDAFNATAAPGPENLFRFFPTNYKSIPTGTITVTGANEERFYTLAVPATLTSTGLAAPYNTQIPLSIPLSNPYVSTGTLAQTTPGTVAFTPGTSPITISIYSGYDSSPPSASALVQTITMNFPSGRFNMPLPTVNCASTGSAGAWVPGTNDFYTDFNARIGNLPNPNASPAANYPAVGEDDGFHHNPSPFIQTGDTVLNLEARSNNPPQINSATACPASGDLRIYAGLTSVPQDYFEAHGTMDTPADGVKYGGATSIIHSLRMYPVDGTWESDTTHGQYVGTEGPTTAGAVAMLINSTGNPATSGYGVCGFNGPSEKYYKYPVGPRGLNAAQVVLTGLDSATHPGDWDTGPGNQPDGPYINKPDESNAGYLGFYTTGGNSAIPEEQGTSYSPNRQISSAVAFGSLPTGIDPSNPDVIGTGAQSNGGIRPWQTLLFCANPAASYTPTGNTVAALTGAVGQHPGFGTPVNPPASTSPYYPSTTYPQPPPYKVPPDSAFLDFFTMPIVEPYAISEPFSTAGKVNMNYQIVPFTYLTRDTAVRAVLKSTRMIAIPQTEAGVVAAYNTTGGSPCYKIGWADPPGPSHDYRYTLNPDELVGTLQGFQQRFNSGDIFRSAAEICSLYLVPQYQVNSASVGSGETVNTTIPPPGDTSYGTPTYATMSTWWKNYTLTGDNAREEPYGQIYPRLTTKSNSYTVHVITQTLKKAPTTSATQFVDGVDQVTSEYRGSYIVQRYLDPNSDSLVEADNKTPGSETDPNSMVGPYKFRVVATKRFAP
jgi:uncharacterized protein (TIGR02600 family)